MHFGLNLSCAAYLAHGTFEWRELAEKAQVAKKAPDAPMRAQGQDGSKGSATRTTSGQHRASKRTHAGNSLAEVNKSQLQQQPQDKPEQPAVAQSSAAAQVDTAHQQKRQLLQQTTEATALPTTPTPSPSGAAGAGVSVAALSSVSESNFLRPSSLDETGDASSQS